MKKTYEKPALVKAGSFRKLTGMGGDHVTWCAPAHYHDLLRRRPLFAIRQLRGFRALHHWPLGETLRALADRRPYRRWLAAAVGNLDKPPPKLASTLGWAAPPRLPPWATGTAVEAARQAIQQAASTAQPLAATRGQHADLANVRAGTRMIRLIEQMSARAGLPMASPFFDDRVIEACLAVRPQERVSPWSYRPLLKAAMRGVVPDECLERTSKAAGDMMIEQSLREQRDQLLAFWDGPVLAEMGLVDEAVIRACLDPLTPQAGREFLNETISCEMWLRAIKGARRDLAATRVTQRQIRGSTCG